MAFESWYRTTLAVEMAPSDVTMTVATPPTITAGRVFLDNWAQQEWMAFTWVSSSILTWLTRGLSKTADPITGWTWLTWMAWTSVKIVAMHDQMVDRANNQTITAERAFSWVNAWLNLTWAKKWLTTPNLTTAQRIALTPQNGMVVFDTDQAKLYNYGNGWWSQVWSWGWWSWAGWSKTSKATDWTVYQAWPNWGIVVAKGTWPTAWASNLQVLSDGSNPPVTVVWETNRGDASQGGKYAIITVPILPNMYYKTVNADTSVDFYEIGSWSWGNTVFVSWWQTCTPNTNLEITHNLNVSQTHVEQGRYTVKVSFTSGGVGWFINRPTATTTWYEMSNTWWTSYSWTTYNWSANTVKITTDWWNTLTNVRVHIIDTWITSWTLPDTSVKCYQSSPTSLTQNAFTKITFNEEQFDTDSMHDNSTNNTRITFNTAWKYMVWANIWYYADVLNTCSWRIWVNNTIIIATWGTTRTWTGSVSAWPSISTIYQFSVGDYIEVDFITPNSSSWTSWTIETSFRAYKI